MLNAFGAQVELSEVLRTHSVIEASAGTGKTYTIERLVTLILTQYPEVALENILLVTFTDKAAGELRERIRTHLEKSVVDLEGDVRRRFETAVENFDQAAIYTIHGFCHRVLMEFAFENNRPFELEMGSDSTSKSRLLADVIRSGWPQLFNAPDSDAIIARVLGNTRALRGVAEQLRADDVLTPGADDSMSPARSAAALSAWTVQKLVARITDAGRSSSVITFQDMISGVRDALDESNPSRDALLAVLRKRFRFALVDEFQDTDPDQWSIFRRIFVEGNGQNRLIVVGDPKQAIYGFRGADVQTYIEARAFICGVHSTGLYRLDTNFRSSPELINGFNAIFAADGWFDQSKDGDALQSIRYDESRFPDDPEKHKRLISDCSGRAAVVPVMINAPGEETKVSAPLARSRLSRFITDEIVRLVEKSSILLKDPDSGVVRRLGYGDICVLARSKADARPVLRALRDRRIPNAFYKQTGLYHSAEAFHTLILLKALVSVDSFSGRQMDPKAALTRFFSLDDGDMAHILAAWRALAAARNWPMLFEGMMTDTGLLIREALQDDGERRIANWRQIFAELACEADRSSLDIHGLVANLEFRRGNFDDEKDSDLHRLESELPKVRVMTIHAAKGLQFPVVFVASGFSSERTGRDGYVRGYAGGKRHFAFVENSKDECPVKLDDDTTRLYYVAMTRAMYRLYFPVNWKPARGSSDPINTFIKNGFESLCAQTEPGEVWTLVDTSGQTVQGAAASVTAENSVTSDTSTEGSAAFDLSVAAPINFAARRLWVDSYSSLKGRDPGQHYVVEGQVADKLDDDGDDPAVQSDLESAGEVAVDAVEAVAGSDDEAGARTLGTPEVEKRAVLLRGGTAVGNAFHGLMETIAARKAGRSGAKACFTDAGVAQNAGAAAGQLILDGNLGGFIEEAMKKHGIPAREIRREGRVTDSAALQFAQLVANALTTPLFENSNDNNLLKLSFCDIPSADTLAEMEFHLDESEFGVGFADGVVPAWRKGLLNGLIDLIFCFKGKYYFLDWKTTRLSGDTYGPDPYRGAALEAGMNEHGYLVQSHIYSLAMMRWLGQRFGSEGPARFGGGFFLFVRGMDAPGRGVWNCARQYSQADVAELTSVVGRLLSTSAARFEHATGGPA